MILLIQFKHSYYIYMQYLFLETSRSYTSCICKQTRSTRVTDSTINQRSRYLNKTSFLKGFYTEKVLLYFIITPQHVFLKPQITFMYTWFVMTLPSSKERKNLKKFMMDQCWLSPLSQFRKTIVLLISWAIVLYNNYQEHTLYAYLVKKTKLR